jgi:hypothetical protein
VDGKFHPILRAKRWGLVRLSRNFPNGTEYKGFFNTPEGAQQFGAQQSAMGGPSTTVVRGTAPTDMVNGSPVHSAATEGPGRLIHNDNLPQVKPQ